MSNEDAFEQLVAQLKEQLRPLLRTTWKPVTAEQDGPVTASKFSGTPYLPAGTSWPVCPHCQQPMQLFVQLNTAELPQAVQTCFGSGLLQLFYCTSTEPFCEIDCEAFFAFSQSVVARQVEFTGPGASAEPPPQAFPARQILSWTALEDRPAYEEASDWLDAQGLGVSRDDRDALWEVASPASGDKLAGWPAWVQGVEYPHCPQCGAQMQLVMQLDSEDHLPYMFGDAGCGHLTQCPQHHDVLAFAWACG